MKRCLFYLLSDIPRGLPRVPAGDGVSKGEPRAPLWSLSARTCFAQAKLFWDKILRGLPWSILLSMLFVMNAEAARMEVIICPSEVICHSAQTHDCRATTDANYWGIDPSASAPRVNAKHYELVSASTAQQHSAGTCVYMNFRKGQRNTVVVLASRHSLMPLRDRHTRWFLDRQSQSWICPKMNNYKKLKPQRCAYVSDISSHRRVEERRERRYSRNRDR